MQAKIWKPLRAEVKIYGRPRLAIIFGLVGMVFFMLIFGMLIGVIGAVLNYYLGGFLSNRVERPLAESPSHTTVRALSHTAVSDLC